ncbi:MAG TPA: cob(I)yrinic acid a,c-diamide adenosyltransferase [Thermodesulfobacteriota bacterium]|nr:cob(I)yrinic acid a,c-diamide adenosyltransferase [Thermodesulfobacteriota bacterium]
MAKKRITKVYTKTGDEGLTSLIGGMRVSKASLRVDAYGDVDELNAVLGLARSVIRNKAVDELLETIQKDLFIVGADLASPPGLDVPRIKDDRIEALEHSIDTLLSSLEPLKEFILPGGKPGGAYLHLARTVARRAERKVARLIEEEGPESGRNVLVYLNRLSDLLFVMARIENKENRFGETYAEFGKK